MRYIAGSWSNIQELDWVRGLVLNKMTKDQKEVNFGNIGKKQFIDYTPMVSTEFIKCNF